MYVVTFYSYKGGVGRTMALVNTAVALARLGRRVLVVDFDLEAPGLPSYQIFNGARCPHGIVDYVSAYRTTGVAPNASEYIVQCDVENIPIWLMPAGDHARLGYSEALQAIDWQDLYANQSGYLMFEDLKQQWAQYEGQGFDYVLVDSRTGHTDVGGICTRQLPDAVVVMFVPNEQNISGLTPIVEGIRAQNDRSSKLKPALKPINLHFWPSNVPDLDDEKEILSKLLKDAEKKLAYDHDPSCVIHHYGSLEILTQSAFIISRPNSRLAKEYENLKTAIIAKNFSDREGAVVALKRIPQLFERARSQQRTAARKALRADAIEIRRAHPKDGEIAYLAARAFSDIGEHKEELEALNVAVEYGNEVNRSLLLRSARHLMASRQPEAKQDLLEVLSSQTATIFELLPALQFAWRIDDFWTEAVEKALDRPDTEFDTLAALTQVVCTQRKGLPFVAKRMAKMVGSNALDETQRRRARNLAVLALIGSGEFSEAIALLGTIDPERAPLEDVFNHAIADWGKRSVAPKEEFATLGRRFSEETPSAGANFHQCYALVLGVLGHLEASRREVEVARDATRASDMEFSCWRYLNVDGDDMLQDLDEMEKRLEGGASWEPPFMAASGPQTVH